MIFPGKRAIEPNMTSWSWQLNLQHTLYLESRCPDSWKIVFLLPAQKRFRPVRKAKSPAIYFWPRDVTNGLGLVGKLKVFATQFCHLECNGSLGRGNWQCSVLALSAPTKDEVRISVSFDRKWIAEGFPFPTCPMVTKSDDFCVNGRHFREGPLKWRCRPFWPIWQSTWINDDSQQLLSFIVDWQLLSNAEYIINWSI